MTAAAGRIIHAARPDIHTKQTAAALHRVPAVFRFWSFIHAAALNHPRRRPSLLHRPRHGIQTRPTAPHYYIGADRRPAAAQILFYVTSRRYSFSHVTK